MSWMDNSVEGNVQTAIQSQTIQTTLEANTSSITDAGFQSYLVNAPIPRVYLKETGTTTLTNGVETVIAYTQASRVHDPYSMLPADLTSTIRIPIDGFYMFDFNYVWPPPTGGGTYLHYCCYRCVKSSVYAAGNVLKIAGGDTTLVGAAGILHYEELSMLKPFKAGDTFTIRGYQVSSVNEDTVTAEEYGTTLAGAWVAPYNQYVGGN